MIIGRSPFRISFAGGGSDLPDFFMHEEGAVVSTTIDKYIYINLHKNFDQNTILLKYTKTERVMDPQKIKNTIARSILSEAGISGIGIEIAADVPAKTGLGSSSSFAVGLHAVVDAYLGKKKLSKGALAEKACETELVKLQCPIGKQDQYAAVYGGLRFYRFLANNKVIVEPVRMQPKKKKELEQNLLLFYTGITRSANTVLHKQTSNLKHSTKAIESTRMMVQIAYKMKAVLEKGDLHMFGKLLHDGWVIKQTLADTITNPVINKYYNLGVQNGAIGGKLLGAGGGGFLLFYCEKKKQPMLRKALHKLREVPFSFTDAGAEIIFKD